MEGRKTRIVIAGGGTGGHLYPALSVAEELSTRHPEAEIVFVGSRRGLEQQLVPAAGYPLLSLSVSGIKGAGRMTQLRSVVAAGLAVVRCCIWMLRSRPALVIGVGGFASGPAVLAARILGVKRMVMEQNHLPGATNRWLAPRVDAICLPSESARARVNGKTYVTGNPVRQAFFSAGDIPQRASLSLLVFGGSRGARSINRAMTEALDELSALSFAPAIVHQTGIDDEPWVTEKYAGYPADKQEVRAYLDDMPQRLAAADLVVCRAGAMALAELSASGRGAVLVPYPHAADDHQTANAETMSGAGAAVLIADRELDGATLARTIRELAQDRPRLRAMGQAARRLAVPGAAARIADIAERLIGEEANDVS